MKRLVLLLTTLTIVMSPSLAKADKAIDGEVIHSASFVGESNHEVSGGVQIIKKGDVQYLVLQEDFKFDGAPDPKLGFTLSDEFVEESLFSGLNHDEGQQVYRLPADFDSSKYDEITIWCHKFSVPLAEAKY
ncbi:MAG: DM13 domain-containing protein [Cyanobacteria bacterium J06621_8]